MIVKFLFMENTCEEHETITENIFEKNSVNKINLEKMRKIRIVF